MHGTGAGTQRETHQGTLPAERSAPGQPSHYYHLVALARVAWVYYDKRIGAASSRRGFTR